MAKKKSSSRRKSYGGFGNLFNNKLLKDALLGLGVGAAVITAQNSGVNIPVDPKIAAGVGGFLLAGPVGGLAGYLGTQSAAPAAGSTGGVYV